MLTVSFGSGQMEVPSAYWAKDIHDLLESSHMAVYQRQRRVYCAVKSHALLTVLSVIVTHVALLTAVLSGA